MSSSLMHMQTIIMLQQQLINQMLQFDSGDSLKNTMFKRREKSGRQISAEALTGRIRSDSRVLRQASANLQEGAAIAGMAGAATTSMLASLEKMRELALERVTSGVNAPGAVSTYNDLAAGVKGTIRSTNYNGISLMDGGGWSDDERLRVAGDGKSASLDIQAGRTARPLTLTDFSDLLNGLDNGSAALEGSTADAQAVADSLSEIISTIKLQDKSYAYMADSFASDAKRMDRQSELLGKAAERNIPGKRKETVNGPLSMLLSDQGKIVDNSL